MRRARHQRWTHIPRIQPWPRLVHASWFRIIELEQEMQALPSDLWPIVIYYSDFPCIFLGLRASQLERAPSASASHHRSMASMFLRPAARLLVGVSGAELAGL